MTFQYPLAAPHTHPEMAGGQAGRAAFLPWREPSLPQLLGPPAPQLHHGDLVKGDQCQKKGAVDPYLNILSYEKTVSQCYSST